MRSGSQLLCVAVAVAAAGCGSNSKPKAFQVVQGDNVVPVSVNGSACGSQPYVNEPCVSVKVCVPGTTTCQTVGGVLLDTGSFGLRIFKQALPLTLPAVAAPGGGSLAECVKYADLSADWGPVVTADVVLANEPAVRVPIQVIDATYGSAPASCQGAEASPTAVNGILGVGVFVEDCGPTCPVDAGQYFAVDGANVTTVAVDASSQVQNPVGLLPGDNNGIILVLPSVPAGGAPSVTGSLVLGIGTRSNNVPSSASPLSLAGAGNVTTTLAGGPAMTGSFVDSGSNGLFFAPPSGSSIPECTASTGWYCPTSTVSFGATNAPSAGFTGSRLRASFQLASVDALTAGNSNAVFANIGGQAVQGGGFDWGLPFFLGRTVYLGYLGRTSPFGNGPTLAY